MLYQLHEFQRALLGPLTAWAEACVKNLRQSVQPLVLCARRFAHRGRL